MFLTAVMFLRDLNYSLNMFFPSRFWGLLERKNDYHLYQNTRIRLENIESSMCLIQRNGNQPSATGFLLNYKNINGDQRGIIITALHLFNRGNIDNDLNHNNQNNFPWTATFFGPDGNQIVLTIVRYYLRDSDLDFILLECDDSTLIRDVEGLELSQKEVIEGEPVRIFHFPINVVQLQTSSTNLIGSKPNGSKIYYSAQTEPSSSGGLITNNDYEPIGLHTTGPEYHYSQSGTLMNHIVVSIETYRVENYYCREHFINNCTCLQINVHAHNYQAANLNNFIIKTGYHGYGLLFVLLLGITLGKFCTKSNWNKLLKLFMVKE